MFDVPVQYFWIIPLVAFVITLIVTPISIVVARRTGAMDIPKDSRRVHDRPIPRIGGIGMYVGISVAYLLAVKLGLCDFRGIDDLELYGVFFGGTVMFLVGLIDDVKGMKPLVKLSGQILSAVIVFACGVRVINFGGFIGSNIANIDGALSLIITVLWIIAIANTINLVDGLDGLAAGVVAISTCCIAYVAYIHGNYHIACFTMLAMAGSCLGFLPYNFYPAKTFMGDCGSQYLGFMLATFAILGPPVKGATIVALIIPALTLSLPIFDTLFAILRRLVNHKPIMEADKEHVHHRLMKTGMGQVRTVLCMYGVTAIMGTAAVLFSRDLMVETAGLCIIAFAFIYIIMTDPNRKSPKLKKD